MCLIVSCVVAQEPSTAPPDADTLRRTVEREVAVAKEQGYVPHVTTHLMRRAKGSGQDARRLLLWAKGALLDLKLPTWAHDVRYYGPGDVQTMDPDRGVVFPGTDFWALAGAFPGQWFRGHCRPHRTGPDQIEAIRRQGKRIGTYMSGGMIPITYALLPRNEDDWCTHFMRQYAGAYWHYGERWWGATGDKPSFREWMLPHLEFAHQVGFDFVHLDEAWGGYPEARAFNDHNPSFLMVTNNFAMTYVDQESFRFGWTAMGEAAGSPRDWDNFLKNLRDRGLKAHNLTTWSYLYYQLDDPEFYHNLAYATTIANKTTDVSLGSPSRQYVAFAHRFRDYLLGPWVSIDVPQESVRLSTEAPTVRTCVTRRFLLGGTEEWIVHFFNTDPKVQQTGGVTVRLTPGNAPLPAKPVITFASPEQPPQEVKVARQENTLTFNAPGVRVWGIAVIGERLFPRVSLKLASRGGASPQHPLDNHVVPGEEFEVEAKAEQLCPVKEDFGLKLIVPSGWQAREKQSRDGDGAKAEGEHRFIVTVPASTPCDRGYAVTPVVFRGHEEMPSFPLQLDAKQRLSFRVFPPCIDSPARKASDFQLEVRNNSAAGLAKVELTMPAGWEANPMQFRAELGPGEWKRFPFTMRAPDMGVSFWYHQDAQCGIKWQSGSGEGTSAVRVRVFPALFSVYHEGAEKLIMHGYPNLYFKGNDFEVARKALESGEDAVLWLVNQDPGKFAPLVDWYLANGGGVVWMGSPFPGDNCPASLEAEEAHPKSMVLSGGQEPGSRIAAPVLRFRAYYESEKGFRAWKVKAKDWARAAAVWGPEERKPGVGIQGAPAIVISADPKRRVAYVASDLETTAEGSYRFEDRLHRQNHWYLTYYLYHLLAWAAGVEK